jgi:Phage gp6-like head-tail connector protein
MSNRIIDIKRVESSPTEPLDLTQVKAHLIITSTDDDTLLTALITQCRKAVEEYCAISIVAKTVTMTADLCKEWELPYGPVTGIQSVATRTGGEGSGPGVYATQNSGWTTDGEEFLSFSPAIAGGFNPGAPFTGFFQWGPYASPHGRGYNRYKIVYTAGYSTVPEPLKLAILNEIAYRYEKRGEARDPNDMGICLFARVIADPYKRLLWF